MNNIVLRKVWLRLIRFPKIDLTEKIECCKCCLASTYLIKESLSELSSPPQYPQTAAAKQIDPGSLSF